MNVKHVSSMGQDNPVCEGGYKPEMGYPADAVQNLEGRLKGLR